MLDEMIGDWGIEEFAIWDLKQAMLDTGYWIKKLKKGTAFRGQGVESIAQGAGGEIDFGIWIFMLFVIWILTFDI